MHMHYALTPYIRVIAVVHDLKVNVEAGREPLWELGGGSAKGSRGVVLALNGTYEDEVLRALSACVEPIPAAAGEVVYVRLQYVYTVRTGSAAVNPHLALLHD
jgi:hypothetical protein